MAFSALTKSNLPLLSKLLGSESSRLVSLKAPISSALIDSEFSRNFATAAGKTEPKVKVPLAMFGFTGNYASALFLASVKSNSLDKVVTELQSFMESSKKSPSFSQFAKDPCVPKKVRVEAIQDLCTQAKFSDISKNFLAVVAENGRLKSLDTIMDKFKQLTMAHKGEVKVIVTTVIPLPAQEEKDLKEILREMLGKDKTIIVEQKIDTKIMGGIIVEFNLKVFDMSIRTRALQMERFLREPVNIEQL